MINSFKNIFIELRLHHWVKNLLVFAVLFFSKLFFDFEKLYLVILLFLSFSFLASSVYIINDIVDVKKDKLHPVKKKRPIASDKISINMVLFVCIILILLAVYLGTFLNLKTNLILILYFVLNLFYSFSLKKIPVVDISIISFMYFLRIKAGGEILNLELSHWLILVTVFLSLFMIIGKRRAEYRSLKNVNNETRVVLNKYNDIFLDHVLIIAVSGVVLTYSLYTVEINKPYLIYSSFFVFFGIFRYLYVIDTFHEGEAPEKLIFKDRWILINGLIWAIYLFFVFYVV
ncbi:hypothetical protein A2272_00510 [Candidatus Peregrinibacteria bacterium RIFOXYA12_FULL_33_12]|nr:MAG: hypothetical protein A2272_00510 [Candidatus Peregrinibacteria bacterium RIFOXYA12_FULL_33_12]